MPPDVAARLRSLTDVTPATREAHLRQIDAELAAASPVVSPRGAHRLPRHVAGVALAVAGGLALAVLAPAPVPRPQEVSATWPSQALIDAGGATASVPPATGATGTVADGASRHDRADGDDDGVTSTPTIGSGKAGTGGPAAAARSGSPDLVKHGPLAGSSTGRSPDRPWTVAPPPTSLRAATPLDGWMTAVLGLAGTPTPVVTPDPIATDPTAADVTAVGPAASSPAGWTGEDGLGTVSDADATTTPAPDPDANAGDDPDPANATGGDDGATGDAPGLDPDHGPEGDTDSPGRGDRGPGRDDSGPDHDEEQADNDESPRDRQDDAGTDDDAEDRDEDRDRDGDRGRDRDADGDRDEDQGTRAGR